MFRRLQTILVLTAWLFASGSHWDLVQAFAWGKMFVTFAQSMRVSTAAEKTFSGEMCSLCKAVDEGKKQETQPTSALSFSEKQFCIPFTSPVLIYGKVVMARWSLSDFVGGGHLRGEPPTPPPRVELIG